MKSTGIVRKIDDLGRVVIPKEIRRTLRIREGDPLEIYTDNSAVILKKYSFISDLSDFASEYVDSIAITSKLIAIVCDRENIIAVSSGNKKEFLGKSISYDVDKAIGNRGSVSSKSGEFKIINDEGNNYAYQVISPIVSGGDPVGALILLGVDNSSIPIEQGEILAKTGATFFGKQMEQ